MTDTLGQPIGGFLNRVFGVIAKAGFGVFLIVAAIAALVATTFIGIMLALAAVFLTFARPRRKAHPVRTGETQTLDARRTADGWVIEL
ncbi:MAG: hypothetical protein ABMA14_23520 [Hyphomonadaceae bacterium]